MTDQTAFGLSVRSLDPADLTITAEERTTLRRLAARLAELAGRPEQDEKRKLWYALNALEAVRPIVFCDPENGWNEIIPEESLACRGELARQWEMFLRKEIFWGGSMGDDRVVEPYFNISYIYTESDWGMHEEKIGGDDGGSYRWDAPLKSYDQLDQLRFPKIEVDRKKTEELADLARDIFGEFLTVRLKGVWWWTLGMTWTLVNLRGLEQSMVDMYDNPEGLHQLMALLRDGHLSKLDFLEEGGLLSLNSNGTYIGSGGFGYCRELPRSDFAGKVRTKDLWGFSESQETCYVSPELFEEYVFPYQYPILERFGLNCYGCCEPLDKRWKVVKRFPRLRRISVSPWADLRRMAENLEDRYVCSLKPNPADLALPVIDEGYIRKSIREALSVTRGCRVEMIMKDNHTLGGNPDNAVTWCRIAREEAEEFWNKSGR
ncbi:MAG TPA: hypothetical protein VLH40_10745 [Atribacteraceae bacterium]|nr:hypothetical protein [Atribacteraceae bacterium]